MNKTTTGRSVTVPDGTYVFVMDPRHEQVPNPFVLLASNAAAKKCIRIAGGCKGMTAEDKVAMLHFFEKAFSGYAGVAFSGGTRQLKDDQTDPMITDVPGAIAAGNKGCIALGTMPRTDTLRLTGESVFTLDAYGTIANPSMAAVLIVQKGAEGKLDWDGDLPSYFDTMLNWQNFAGFQLGMVAWNGGAITKDEILKSIANKWPTILIEGSGRACDELIAEYKAGEKPAYVHIVSKENPEALRALLVDLGFIG